MMNRPGHDGVRFFVGREIEHSPAHGQVTLFVVGVQPVADIVEAIDQYNFCNAADPITHVYFGANRSFPCLATNDHDGWMPWERMIAVLLDRGHWCTLDFDVSCVAGVCESALVEHRQFIPMISVRMPYVLQLGYNATLKIDDQDFAATNAGVWCHPVLSLLDRSKFTAWKQYEDDSVQDAAR